MKKVLIAFGCMIGVIIVLGAVDANRLRAESFEKNENGTVLAFSGEANTIIAESEKSNTEHSVRYLTVRPTQTPKPTQYPDFDLEHLSIIKQEESEDDSSRIESIGESAEDHGAGEGSEPVDEIADESSIGTDTDDDADSGYAVEMEGSADEANFLGGYTESSSNEGYSFETDTQDSGEPAGLTYLGTWTTTAYCPCEICCGVWATGCTASGVLATPNHTVACGSLPFGTQVMIDGMIYIVEDTGVEGEWIDIFFSSHEEALAYGMQMKEVYLVG